MPHAWPCGDSDSAYRSSLGDAPMETDRCRTAPWPPCLVSRRRVGSVGDGLGIPPGPIPAQEGGSHATQPDPHPGRDRGRPGHGRPVRPDPARTTLTVAPSTAADAAAIAAQKMCPIGGVVLGEMATPLKVSRLLRGLPLL